MWIQDVYIPYGAKAKVVFEDVPREGYVIIWSMKCKECHQNKRWCYYDLEDGHICGQCFENRERANEREITL